MVLHSGLQSERRAVSPPQVWDPAVGSRDRQSSAPTVPGSGECACGPPHAGRAHAAPRGAARDPGGCPVPSLHPRLPRRGWSLPPTPDDSYSLSFHQVIGRGGYIPPGPCPLKSGLGRPGCGHCCRHPAAWRSPGVPPAGMCTCCPSRMLPGSRAAPCRTGAAAQAPRARHGHGARPSAPAGRYAGPARTPARLATGAAAPHGLAGGAVLTLGKDPGPQPQGACGQGGGRADAAGATDPGWRPC